MGHLQSYLYSVECIDYKLQVAKGNKQGLRLLNPPALPIFSHKHSGVAIFSDLQ